ncbi:glycosyltransferase [Sinomonas gamaensis]|uniref:glycosyltransferase n=1 Tax=Sinomonas gamaensis TaxID=2565624 RepID=UPI001108CE28|nr:glycosyltransferase [Sinomonas gamaensis]
MKSVTVYDPNHLNPYGRELARILSGSGFRIRLWISEEQVSSIPPSTSVQLGLLPGQGLHGLIGFIRRVVLPLRLAMSRMRDPLVVVWTRDSWDGLVFGLRAIAGGKTAFVHHNPVEGRGRNGWARRSQEFLEKHARVLVHQARLAPMVRRSRYPVQIVVHPPYRQIRDLAFQDEITEAGNRPRLAFVGALRRDKGFDDLSDVASMSDASWDLLLLGPAPEHELESLSKRLGDERKLITPGRGHRLSDKELSTALRTCRLMIAPYTSVTESGSINLALSIGTPVLAYDSPGTYALLNSSSLSKDAAGLARLIDKFLESPWDTFSVTFEERERSSSDSWKKALESLA